MEMAQFDPASDDGQLWRAKAAGLQNVLDTLVDGVIVIGPDGVVRSINPAAEAMFGYASEEVVGHSVNMLMPNPYAAAHDGYLRRYQSDGVRRIIGIGREVQGRRKDGSVVPLDLAVSEATLNGQPVFTGVVRDITLRKQAERGAARFSAIVNSSSDAIVSLDMDGSVTSWNPAAERMFGFTEAQMLGRKLMDLLPPECRDFEGQAFERVREGAEVSEYESFRMNRDGMKFAVSCALSPIRDSAGHVLGVVGITRDMTVSKRQLAALRNSEETMRAAMEHASVGMALMTLGGRCLRVNQALSDLVGYTCDELLNMDLRGITHPDDMQPEAQTMHHALDTGEGRTQFDKRVLHKSGKVLFVQTNMSLVQVADSLQRYFIVQFLDLTARQEMEQMKSDFVSMVSHELRTPMTSIRGSLGLIMGAMRSELSDRVAKLIGIAHNNAERLIVLINDILDIDKIASGKMRFESEFVNLSEVVRQSVESVQAYAAQYGVQVKIEQADDTLFAWVDVSRLVQVMSNYLSNAIKFSHKGGQVEVIMSRHDGMARVSVVDHGAGIDEAFKPSIFGRFMQADSTMTRSKGGTGLGLHITKQIVEYMGGSVGFDSTVGEGSTFWLQLPLLSRQPGMVESDGVRISQSGNLFELDGLTGAASANVAEDLPYILHIEDDPEFGAFIEEVLRDRAQVVSVRNLGQARSALTEWQFDGILLDIGLPDGSALDCLNELNTLSKGSPIVILSVTDVPDSILFQVAAVLVKSRISEEQVVQTMLRVALRSQS